MGQCVTVRCSALQCVAVCYSVLQCVTVCCNVCAYCVPSRSNEHMFYVSSMRCNPERHDACVCNVCVCSFDLQVTQWQHKHTHLFDLLVTAQTHDTLQHTATHCNTLVTAHTHTLPGYRSEHDGLIYVTRLILIRHASCVWTTWHVITAHCSVLQCILVCCSVL